MKTHQSAYYSEIPLSARLSGFAAMFEHAAMRLRIHGDDQNAKVMARNAEDCRIEANILKVKGE